MRSRPLRAAATLLLLPLGTAAAVVGIAGAASAAPSIPPAQGSGHNIIVFPVRDFVSATGYGVGSSVTVQVVRGGTVVSTSEPVTPQDDPLTAGFDGIVEVNHPGGGCWLEVTPDIKAGDTVLVREVNDGTGLDFTDGTVTANVVVTSPATETDPGTIEVHGTATDSVGNPIDITTLDQRLVANRDAFDANGRRTLRAASVQDDGLLTYDAPGSTHWTAVYTGLTPADVARATGAESRILWLGGVPADAVESTIYEYGAVGGPSGAPCTAPLNAPVATVTPADTLFSATEIGSLSAAKPLTIANTGAGTNADLTVTSVTSDSPDFVVDGAPCAVIATGTSCATQTVTFAPAAGAAGIRTGTITVASDGVTGPQKVTVTGLALEAGSTVAKVIARPTKTTFATRLPGSTSPAERVTFTNIGNTPANPDAVVVTDASPEANYAVSAQTCTTVALAADASCTVDVTFTPSTVGPLPAALVVQETGTTLATSALAGEGLDVVNVNDPPATEGVSILVFTLRDFVSASGFAATDTVAVEVIRHGVVVGFSGDQIPQDDPLTAAFDGIVEINHPGGGCWGNPYTPDIRPGDIVRTIISNPSDPTRDGQADQTHVVDVGEYTAGGQETNDLVIHGWARGIDGKRIPVGQLSQRFVANKQAFLVNGRRTLRAEGGGEGVITYDPIGPGNLDGTNWTATYKGLAQADIDRALATSEARIIWLGRDPIALFEGSFYEFGLEGGPAAGFCTTPAAPATPDYQYAPNALTFPTRGVDTTASPAKTVTLRNTGNADLNLASISLEGPDAGEFTLTPATTCTATSVLTPGQACTFVVTFNPTGTPGDRSAKIVVTDDVVGPPQSIPLTATASAGVVPFATADVSAIDFGNQVLNQPSAFSRVTVTNEGQAPLPLTVDSVTFGGTNGVASTHDFGLAATANPNTCTADVAPGDSCTVDIIFTGSALNERTSSVTIAALPADLTVALTGRITAVGKINDPPAGGHSILVFPERDFVSAAGYDANDNATVEVVRNGKVIGSVVNVVPQDDPKTAGFDGLVDVNHPGGACWDNNTVPDIKPGDIVRIFPNGIDPLDNQVNPLISDGDQTHVQGVTVTQSATETPAGSGTVIVRGSATDVFTGKRIPIDQLEVRLINKSLFEANGKRTLRAGGAGGDGTVAYDTPAGKTFTATFTGLSDADVQRTLENIDPTGRNIGGETRSIWLGRDPLALTELTFFEHGVVGGAAAPCTGTLTTAALTSTPAAAVFPVQAFATAATQSITLTITNVGNLDANLEAPVITGGNAASDFRVEPDSPHNCPVAPNVLEFGGPPFPTCTIEVQFTPSQAGIRTSTLQLVSDATGSPLVVQLSGVAAVQPHLTTITPPNGSAGTPVTLTGTGFAGVDQVAFGATVLPPAQFTVVNDTTITTVVPVGASGVTPVTVTNLVGTSTEVVNFTASAPPTVGTISPTSGSAALKTAAGAPANLPITITGTDLDGGDAGASTRVLFNGVASTSVTVAGTGTSVTATVPVGATSGPITVVTALGQATTLGSFTVLTPPAVTSITGATTKPGSTATVNGTGFTAAANANVGLSTVQLRRTGVAADLVGASPARTATTIRFTVPANAADVYNLYVRTPVTYGATTYFLESPVPQLFTAASTPVISKACAFLTQAAASAGACPNGTAVIGGAGTWVRVEGSGYSGLSSVQFGGQKATVFSLPGDDPTLTGKVILTQVPTGSKSGTIQVLSAGGSVSANGFTFVAVPTVTTVAPTTATRNVTTVTLTGTGYTASPLQPVVVTLFGPNGVTQTTPALTSVTATQIRFVVPAGTPIGLNTIQVKTIGGTATSPQRVTVN